MNDLDLLNRIKRAILAENIPLDWIRNNDSTLTGLEIFYLPEATTDQRARAHEIAAAVITNPEDYNA